MTNQFHQQLIQPRALLLLPFPPQSAGAFCACHGEGRGIVFIITAAVEPTGGAGGGCVVLLVTYRAFPHGDFSLVAFGLFPPLPGQGRVPRHAPALLIAICQGALGVLVPLFGGFAVPMGGLVIIPLYPQTLVIVISQVILRRA